MDRHSFSPDLVFPEEDVFWYDVVREESHVPVLKQSAFKPYTKNPEQVSPTKPLDGGREAAGNMQKRMLDLLERTWEEKSKAAAPARERCRRHMINERVRRDKQRQSYFALHSLLPSGTKKDKNSIVQSALNRIGELQREKKELERRTHMLEGNLKTLNEERGNRKGKKIRLKVEDPISGMDSMLEALRCLKHMGTKPNTIKATFSPQEFSTIIDIQTQIAGDEVEKKLEKTLQEAEWKLLFLPEASFSKY